MVEEVAWRMVPDLLRRSIIREKRGILHLHWPSLCGSGAPFMFTWTKRDVTCKRCLRKMDLLPKVWTP